MWRSRSGTTKSAGESLVVMVNYSPTSFHLLAKSTHKVVITNNNATHSRKKADQKKKKKAHYA